MIIKEAVGSLQTMFEKWKIVLRSVRELKHNLV